MKTSVFKEILYHSLDGNKTYGGTLEVDRLVVPTDEVADYEGTGNIDGSAFMIGSRKSLASVRSRLMIAYNDSGYAGFLLRRGADTLAELSYGTTMPELIMRSAGQTEWISIKPDISRFVKKVIIGDENLSNVYGAKLAVVGLSEFWGDTTTTQTARANLLISNTDVMSENYSLEEIGDSYYTTLGQWAPVYTLGLNRLTYDIISQIRSLSAGDVNTVATLPAVTVNNAQWNKVSTMQDVASNTVGANFHSLKLNVESHNLKAIAPIGVYWKIYNTDGTPSLGYITIDTDVPSTDMFLGGFETSVPDGLPTFRQSTTDDDTKAKVIASKVAGVWRLAVRYSDTCSIKRFLAFFAYNL